MSTTRAMLMEALSVTGVFVEASAYPMTELLAHTQLEAFRQRYGADDAAATLAALSSLIALMWAESSQQSGQAIVELVMRRLTDASA